MKSLNMIMKSSQVRSECLTCTFRASCCSARLSRALHRFLCPGQEITKFKFWPLIPNVGPCDGCLTQANTFLFRQEPSAWASPMVVVLLPSPRGVGVILQEIDFIYRNKNSVILFRQKHLKKQNRNKTNIYLFF